MTCIMPFSSATSEPLFWRMSMSAYFAISILRGSQTISVQPPLLRRSLMNEPMTGCVSVVFDPMIRTTSACRIDS